MVEKREYVVDIDMVIKLEAKDPEEVLAKIKQVVAEHLDGRVIRWDITKVETTMEKALKRRLRRNTRWG